MVQSRYRRARQEPRLAIFDDVQLVILLIFADQTREQKVIRVWTSAPGLLCRVRMGSLCMYIMPLGPESRRSFFLSSRGVIDDGVSSPSPSITFSCTMGAGFTGLRSATRQLSSRNIHEKGFHLPC